MFKAIKVFLGMYAPSRRIRMAMYRSAGVRIGKVAEFGSNIWIDTIFKNLVVIEDDVIMSGHNLILSHSFLMANIEEEGFCPVEIKKGARIGLHCIILAGVTIGENSVIGAGSVVVKDIPPNCIAAGNPAKPLRFHNKPVY